MEKEGVSGRAHVITVSDGVSAGIREDVSGRAVVDLLKRARFGVSGPEVVPDTHDSITDAIVAAVIAGEDLIVTTGGTRLGPRDLTPHATSMLHEPTGPGPCEPLPR